MKKRLFILGMCMALAFSMTACKKDSDSKQDEKESSALAAGLNENDKVVEGDSKVTELADYTKLQVYSSQVEVTDLEMQNSIASVLAYFPVTEGTVTETDVLNIDFVGKIDGEEFEGGSAKGQTLDMQNNSYIPGFASGLLGKKIGDTVELNLTFPDSYHKEEYRGKDATFTVTINSKTPELTDKFVKDNLAAECEATTVQELREYLEKQAILGKKYNLIWTDYVGSCVAELSKERTDELVESDLKDYESYITAKTGQDLQTYLESESSSYDEFKEMVLEEAKVVIKEKAVIEAIAQKENITVSDEEYQKEVDYYMNAAGFKTEEEFEEAYDSDKIRENILFNNVLEWLCNQVQVVEGEPDTEATS